MKRQDRILQNAELISKAEFSENLENLNGTKLHYAISRAIMADIQNNWKITNIKKEDRKDSTTYREYMEMNNLEVINDVY